MGFTPDLYFPEIDDSESSGLITILFLWVATAALIWPANTVRELFAIPIATLFAFTSVRANLPGAPDGFGE